MGSDHDAPGRDTRPAYSTQRRTWYGHGQLTTAEKGAFNRFLHDMAYVFADISIFGLPALTYVMATDSGDRAILTGATLSAWTTIVLVATAIRGGWLKPLATDTLGWLALTPAPALVGLRLLAYNFIIVVAGSGGVELATLIAVPGGSIAIAAVLALVSTLAVPRIAETVSRRVSHDH